MTAPRAGRVRSGQASIYYEIAGEGPALVLAHGAGGNRVIWYQQVPHFAKVHRVIAFDHRGFGRSQCPEPAFSPEHFPGDLLAILDAEQIERAALVCQSMGGWTGLPTALRHPERVACLVLCGTPGGLFTAAVAEAAAQIAARIEREGVRGNAALAPDFAVREPARAHLYDQISALNPGLPPAALARLFDPKVRLDPQDLEGFSVPTLVVAGEHDPLFGPKVLREVAQSIPGAELREFPGVGHSSYFEDPLRFNEWVGDFVRRHP
ncbi:MAG: alpha/beta fold hydrolase [Myxococcota bacterium]